MKRGTRRRLAANGLSSRTRRLTIAVCLLLGSLPARAEVWPNSGRGLVLGPEALVRGGALGLVENPALLASAGAWSLGGAWLEPFGVQEFTRWDMAASRGLGRFACGFGWSQLGTGSWGTRSLLAGGASALAAERFTLGGVVRRSGRQGARAWSADLGLWSRPTSEIAVGLVARSVWRGAERAAAPVAEWSAGVVWSPEPLALGFSILRDAVGPIENRWSARVSLGPLDTQLAYADRPGDDRRVALALSLRAGAVRLSGGQESGRILPETRAGAVEWSAPAATRFASRSRWGFTAGVVGSGERALGIHGGAEWSRLDSERRGILLALSGSRDPGEPNGLDEGRLYARAAHRKLGTWHAGALDLHVGRGVAISQNGGHSAAGPGQLVAIENAADFTRSPVPAPTGVALTLGREEGSRLLLAATRLWRDARSVDGALWPIGGRLHRTAAERARRGALREEIAVVACQRPVGRRVVLGAAFVAARYGGLAARLVPGGRRARAGTWYSASGVWRGPAGRFAGEAALDEAGRSAFSLHGQFATAARRARLRVELLLERSPPGFTAAAAWPTLARFANYFARAELSPFAALGSLALARRWEERWLAPTAALPGRRQWITQSTATVERRSSRGSLSLTAGVRSEQRPATSRILDAALWNDTRRAWWEATWIWRPAGPASLRLRPSWRRTAAGWRESWALAVSGEGPLAWRIETTIRPGGLAAEDSGTPEVDPLGGYHLLPSTSPARLRLVAAHGPAEAEFSWSETMAGTRPEIWLRLRGAGSSRLW